MNVTLNACPSFLSQKTDPSSTSKDLVKVPLTASPSIKDFFYRLPEKVSLLNFSYLSYRELSLIARVNRKMNVHSKNDHLWSQLYKSHFGRPINLPIDKQMSSKSLFQKDLEERTLLEKVIIEDYAKHRKKIRGFTATKPPSFNLYDSPRFPIDKIWYENILKYMCCGGDPHLTLEANDYTSYSLTFFLFKEFIYDNYPTFTDHHLEEHVQGENRSDAIDSHIFKKQHCLLALDSVLESPRLNLDSPLDETDPETLWTYSLNHQMLTRRLLKKRPVSISTLNSRLQLILERQWLHKNFDRHKKMAERLLEKGADFCLSDPKGWTLLLHLCEKKFGSSDLNFFCPPNHQFNVSKVYPLLHKDFLKKTLKIRKEFEQRLFPTALTALILTYRTVGSDYFSIRDHEGNNFWHIFLKNCPSQFKTSDLDELLLETGVEAIFQRNNAGEMPLNLFLEDDNLELLTHFLKKHPNKKAVEELYAIFQKRIHAKKEARFNGERSTSYGSLMALQNQFEIQNSFEQFFKEQISLPVASHPS